MADFRRLCHVGSVIVSVLRWRVVRRPAQPTPEVFGGHNGRARVIDLQCDVVDAVALLEQAGDGVLAFVTVVAAIYEDVSRERGEARRDFPDVEVVHIAHAVDCVQVGVDGGDVDATGSGFEEDPPRFADQSPARPSP